MKKIAYILFLIYSSITYAASLDEQCQNLLQSLEELQCDESIPNIASFMSENIDIIKDYELGIEDKRQDIELIYNTLNESANTVQNCLIKHVEEPRHKHLITAQVSMSAIVIGLEWWIKDKDYLSPSKEYVLGHYEEEIKALNEFSN